MHKISKSSHPDTEEKAMMYIIFTKGLIYNLHLKQTIKIPQFRYNLAFYRYDSTKFCSFVTVCEEIY